MKKLIFIALLFPFALSAQHLELGLSVGGATYYGDIAPDPVLSETNLAIGFYARVNMSSSFAFVGSITSATLTGDDKNSSYTQLRNINFSTPITEYAAMLEFNFIKYGVDVLDKKFTPYVFLGIALTEFNPQATYPGIGKVNLRNMRTENASYGNFATCLPFGMGVKWQAGRHWALQANVGFRKAYSDYLDDVSTVYPDPATTVFDKGVVAAAVADPSRFVNNGIPAFGAGYKRGNADYSDWYILSGISISYRFYKNTKCRRFY